MSLKAWLKFRSLKYNWWEVEQQISRIESKKSNLSWPIILKTISSDVKILRCITKFPAVTPTYVVFDSWLFVGIHYHDWRNVSKAKYLWSVLSWNEFSCDTFAFSAFTSLESAYFKNRQLRSALVCLPLLYHQFK